MRSVVFTGWMLLGIAALLAVAVALPYLFANEAPAETAGPAPAKPRPPQPLPAEPQALLKPVALNLNVTPQGENERLEYEIRWNGVPAGRAEMLVHEKTRFVGDNGPETYYIKLNIRSSRVVSTFYPVKNKARSWIDTQGGFSRLFYQDRQEGLYRYLPDQDRYWTEERMRFDYTLGEMEALHEQQRPDLKWRTYRVPLEGKVLDPLAAIYYLRALDFTDKKPVVLPIFADRRVWNTRVIAKGVCTLPVAGFAEKQECVGLVLSLPFRGLFEHRSDLQLWLHKATGVPVQMKVELPIGPCEVTLISSTHSPLEALRAGETPLKPAPAAVRPADEPTEVSSTEK